MSAIRYNGRQGAASLLCLYVVLFLGAVMGAPPTDGNSGSAAPLTEGIAVYATNDVCYNNLEAMGKLYLDAENIYTALSAYSLALPEFNTSPEIKETEQKECDEYMERIDRIINDLREYVYLKEILNKYRVTMDELQTGNSTDKRLTELSDALLNLEQEFEGKKELAENMMTPDIFEYYSVNIRDAEEFIDKRTVQEPTQTTNKNASATEKKASGDVIAVKAQRSIESNMRDAKDDKKSSAHLTMGMRVMQAMVVVGVIAAF
ncbi:odorant receptor 2, putative [Babesia ovata]|uniref:Odorant receptor 2, putative n=1 Tax=Babesia ovata TaxID=189622 RepID=A0A2H6KCD9_9APIC|nr:odorant receptor 2, putative [Babesia ovata]GBE60663.1 odorant receptor 2, putative [Babesia ovata]